MSSAAVAHEPCQRRFDAAEVAELGAHIVQLFLRQRHRKPLLAQRRAAHGIIALAALGIVGCSGSTGVEREGDAQTARQAQAVRVSVLTVEGMT